MNREEQIETLEEILTEEQAQFLTLETWEPLPTQETFYEWLGVFLVAWNRGDTAVKKALDYLAELLTR